MNSTIMRSGSDTSIPSMNLIQVAQDPGFDATKRNSLFVPSLDRTEPSQETSGRRYSDSHFSLITGPFSIHASPQKKVKEDQASDPTCNNNSLYSPSSLLSPVGFNNFSCWLRNVFTLKPGGPPCSDDGDYDTMTFLMDMDGGGGLCFNDVFQKYAASSTSASPK